MNAKIVILAVFCVVGVTPTISDSFNSLLLGPDHNENTKATEQDTASNVYEYQLVPSSEYAISVNSSKKSVMDLIRSPLTALTTICSKALSVISWVFSNGSLIFLGMTTVIGFCALTPYCTLTIEQTFARELRSVASYIPYLDEIESFLFDAYNKYNSIQDKIY